MMRDLFRRRALDWFLLFLVFQIIFIHILAKGSTIRNNDASHYSKPKKMRSFVVEEKQYSDSAFFAEPGPERKATRLIDPNKQQHTTSTSHPFAPVIFVSTANSIINTFRPDPHIPWTLRVPRILWEVAIALVARTAATAARKSSTSTYLSASPHTYLLLCIMLLTTAVTDIFLWAPVFAYMTNFETCHGGWWTRRGGDVRCYRDYAKGMSRLVVVFQSIVGGLVYLSTSLVAWNGYVACRDQQKVNRDVLVMERMEQLKQQQQQLMQQENNQRIAYNHE